MPVFCDEINLFFHVGDEVQVEYIVGCEDELPMMLIAVDVRDNAIREDRIQHAIHFIGEYNCVFEYDPVQLYSPGEKFLDSGGIHLQFALIGCSICSFSYQHSLPVGIFCIRIHAADAVIHRYYSQPSCAMASAVNF